MLDVKMSKIGYYCPFLGDEKRGGGVKNFEKYRCRINSLI